MPLEKETGIKTAASTMATPTSAPLIWLMAFFVASRGESPSSAMTRSTFSTTTMASSTSRPMASTRPNMESVLMLKPSAAIRPKVPSSTTGMAIAGMIVARQFCRKSSITRTTSAMPSSSVFTTSVIEAVMNGVTSFG